MSTWLTAIVINCARMHLRRLSRFRACSIDQQLPGESLAFSELLADPKPNAEQNLLRSEQSRVIARLTESLPAPERKVLQLRFTEGQSLKDAAETLGISVSNLKSRASRGRARMMQQAHKALGRREAPPRSRVRQKAMRSLPDFLTSRRVGPPVPA